MAGDERVLDLSIDPRDAVIAKQAIEIEETMRALHQALNSLREIDKLLCSARALTRTHG